MEPGYPSIVDVSTLYCATWLLAFANLFVALGVHEFYGPETDNAVALYTGAATWTGCGVVWLADAIQRMKKIKHPANKYVQFCAELGR